MLLKANKDAVATSDDLEGLAQELKLKVDTSTAATKEELSSLTEGLRWTVDGGRAELFALTRCLLTKGILSSDELRLDV